MKNKSFKILDCTIRDGGYYTNWDFPSSIVDNYIDALHELPIDYIEVGYRSNRSDVYLGKYFYTPISVLKHIKSKTNKKLAIILNEKNIRVNEVFDLLNPIQEYVSLVRLAIDPKNFKRALELAQAVKGLGFDVAFNVMYMSTWKENKAFLELLPQVNGIADYFYMVDSFGGVIPSEVSELINLVKSKTDVKLGFHGHNNLEMALANTLTAIEEGIDIVDGTITGMGRGAGNLKTELLLTVLQSQKYFSFDYNALTKTVSDFTELQKYYSWGTNLPYMVSGANSLPQSQVMEWVGKRYYSFNSIIRALNNQSRGEDDNQSLPKLSIENKNYTSALIVGGGATPVEHSEAIQDFLKQSPNLLIIHASSKNALTFAAASNDQIFCLVGNEGHRLENVFGSQKINGICVLPPYPRKMGTYTPKILENNSYELEEVNFSEAYKDSHTAIALQIAKDFNIQEIMITGYDAYKGNISLKEQELVIENQYLFSKFKKSNQLDILSITPTGYSELKEMSVYSFLK